MFHVLVAFGASLLLLLVLGRAAEHGGIAVDR
jgi:hypothetical protein